MPYVEGEKSDSNVGATESRVCVWIGSGVARLISRRMSRLCLSSLLPPLRDSDKFLWTALIGLMLLSVHGCGSGRHRSCGCWWLWVGPQRAGRGKAFSPNRETLHHLGFEAQPRNPCSKSPCARCRPHMVPPDLSTARPPSTQPVRPSPVLCTRSPTPTTVLVAACHAAPTTCTPRDKQTRFSKRNKGKRKPKQNYPGFEFKPRHVNDSSQSNQEMDHLVSQIGRPETSNIHKINQIEQQTDGYQ
jgi:hypothetical protein